MGNIGLGYQTTPQPASPTGSIRSASASKFVAGNMVYSAPSYNLSKVETQIGAARKFITVVISDIVTLHLGVSIFQAAEC